MDYRKKNKTKEQDVEIDAEVEKFVDNFNKIIEKNFLIYKKEISSYSSEHYEKMHQIMREIESISREMGKLGFNVYLYNEELAFEYNYTHSQGFINEYKIEGVQIDCFKDPYRNYFKDYMNEKQIYSLDSEIQDLETALAKIQKSLFKFTKKNQEKILTLTNKVNRLKTRQREFEKLDKLSKTYDKMDENGRETFAQFMKLKRALFDEEYEFSHTDGKLRRMRNIHQFFGNSINHEDIKKILKQSWAEVPQEEKDMILKKLSTIKNRSAYKGGDVLNMISFMG